VVEFIIIFRGWKLTNAGIFRKGFITSANGKLKRAAWIRIFPRRKKFVPVVVRSKEDLKAEGDRLMGIKREAVKQKAPLG